MGAATISGGAGLPSNCKQGPCAVFGLHLLGWSSVPSPMEEPCGGEVAAEERDIGSWDIVWSLWSGAGARRYPLCLWLFVQILV